MASILKDGNPEQGKSMVPIVVPVASMRWMDEARATLEQPVASEHGAADARLNMQAIEPLKKKIGKG